MDINIKKWVDKGSNMKKRYLFLIALFIFCSIFIKVKYFKDDNRINNLSSLKPKKNFVVEDIRKEEEENFFNMIQKEEERDKGVGRDIFFSNISIQETIPDLKGIMIGRKKTAIFSDGELYTIGDVFFGNTIKEISRRKVVVVDEYGEESILEIRGE